MKDEIIVVGASGHAKVILDIIEKAGIYRVAGVLDSSKKKGEIFESHPVLGDIEEFSSLKIRNIVIAIGDNHTRSVVVAKLRSLRNDVVFPALVHPSAVLSAHAKIGEGTVVMAGAIIGVSSHIEKFCILNTGCVIDHDGNLADFASLAPGAILGGNVSVGLRSSIGLGASVIHSIKIGADTVVGAGAVVLGDLPNSVTAYGNPCRTIRPRTTDEPYLKKRLK